MLLHETTLKFGKWPLALDRAALYCYEMWAKVQRIRALDNIVPREFTAHKWQKLQALWNNKWVLAKIFKENNYFLWSNERKVPGQVLKIKHEIHLDRSVRIVLLEARLIGPNSRWYFFGLLTQKPIYLSFQVIPADFDVWSAGWDNLSHPRCWWQLGLTLRVPRDHPTKKEFM